LSVNLSKCWELDKNVEFKWEKLDISCTFDMEEGEYMDYTSLAVFIRELAYCKTPLKVVMARRAHQDQIDTLVNILEVSGYGDVKVDTF
jgi:hypothetical protein